MSSQMKTKTTARKIARRHTGSGLLLFLFLFFEILAAHLTFFALAVKCKCICSSVLFLEISSEISSFL